MKAGSIVTVLLAIVVGLGAGYLLRGGSDTAAESPTDTEIAEDSADAADVAARLEDVEADRDRLRRELSRAEGQASAAREAAERAEAALAEIQKSLEAETVVEDTRDWRDRLADVRPLPLGDLDPAIAAALENIDWVTIGESMGGMSEIIPELMDSLADGGQLPAKLVGEVQQMNGALVGAAIQLSNDGVPGTGFNGAFSHPAFMSNAIASALEARELPLSEDQKKALDRVGRDFSAREAERLAGYDDTARDLQKLLDESDLKATFFDDAMAVLTTAQHEALRPLPVRDITTLDIFSESLVWVGRAQPMPFADLDGLTQSVLANTQYVDRSQAEEIVSQWVRDLPQDLVGYEPTTMDLQGRLHVDQIRRSAGSLIDLLDRFESAGLLDENAREKMRQVGGTIVPLHQPDDQ